MPRDVTAGLDAVLRRQAGVISRRQVLAAGADDGLIRRRLRRRDWARCFEGVYVDRTGPLTRPQRDWAAVLVHDRAALDAASALRAWGVDRGGSTRTDIVDLDVAAARRVDDPPGLRTTRLRYFETVARLDLSPPRVRLEHAALTLASRSATDDAAVAVLADVVAAGATTVRRLRDELDGRRALPRRRLLAEVLADVEDGARSPLERRYLREVEAAHRLPAGRRQVREAVGDRGRVVYRDVDYPLHHTVVELDGRLGHTESRDRWADLDRDLATAVAGRHTLRVGWAQVLDPCRLADTVAAVLAARGAGVEPVRCGPACDVGG